MAAEASVSSVLVARLCDLAKATKEKPLPFFGVPGACELRLSCDTPLTSTLAC
jgi:hypothetical protein